MTRPCTDTSCIVISEQLVEKVSLPLVQKIDEIVYKIDNPKPFVLSDQLVEKVSKPIAENILNLEEKLSEKMLSFEKVLKRQSENFAYLEKVVAEISENINQSSDIKFAQLMLKSERNTAKRFDEVSERILLKASDLVSSDIAHLSEKVLKLEKLVVKSPEDTAKALSAKFAEHLRLSEMGCTKLSDKVDEMRVELNSEFLRVSDLKHSDFMAVVSDKFANISEKIRCIMSDMRTHPCSDVSAGHRPKVFDIAVSDSIQKASSYEYQASEHIRGDTVNLMDPNQVLNIVDRLLSLVLPCSTPSSASTTSGGSERDMPSARSDGSEQRLPSIMSDHSEHRSSNDFVTLRDQVSAEIKHMMSKVSDISDDAVTLRDQVSAEINHMLSKLKDISEKVSVHRISEVSCAKGSDQFGSEQPVAESCRAGVGSEHGICEKRPADGSKQLGSSDGVVSKHAVSESCPGVVAMQLVSEGLPVERGISEGRIADGFEQHASDEHQVDFSEI